MNNKEVLLSIVCPAYNAEKTVEKMVASLENQPYKNYEIILVNDGSKDNTLSIITKLSKKYDNIFIIDKENSGAGLSRNEGIKIANGKYITFADADDTYTDNFFEVIIPEIEKKDFELLVFNANVYNGDKYLNKLISSKYDSNSFVTNDGLKKYLQGEFCHRIGNVPWNKIYSKDIIDNKKLYYTNKRKGQDLVFNMLYCSNISKYKYINESLYNYDINMNTIADIGYREKLIQDMIEFNDPVKDICENSNLKEWEQYYGLFILRRIPEIIQNESLNNDFKKFNNNLKKYLKNEEVKKYLSSIKFKDFDFKLLICYIIYKFKFYNIIFILLNKGVKKNASRYRTLQF